MIETLEHFVDATINTDVNGHVAPIGSTYPKVDHSQ